MTNQKLKKSDPKEIKKSQMPILKDSIELYLQEIAKFPVLNKKEEETLSQKFYSTKDPQIAKILAQANLRFVVKIAMEYTHFGTRLIDLIQEGNIGLLQAIKQFNPYKGVRLITYAVWWIRGYIQEYLLRQYSLVRIGTTARQRRLFYLLRKQQAQLIQMTQPKKKKLLEFSKKQKKEFQAMKQRLYAKDISLDQPVGENHSSRLIDLQPDNKEHSLEDELNFSQEKHIMNQAIKKLRPQLNEKELLILDKRLLSDQPLTLQKIGQTYSVTREYIRQIEHQLIKKIKSAMNSQSLPKK